MVKTYFVYISIIISSVTGCKTLEQTRSSPTNMRGEKTASKVGMLITKYCQACHAVGDIRFINSEDPEIVWEDIFVVMGPYKVPWATVIYDRLNWPVDDPEKLFKPAHGSDWMPLGSKRYDIVDQKINGESARKYLLAALAEELKLRNLPLAVDRNNKPDPASKNKNLQ
jgi:hypothetical protein